MLCFAENPDRIAENSLGETMVGRTRVLYLGSASALAIGASVIFMPVQASACTATSAGANAVDIICAAGDDPVNPFLTSYNSDGLPISDGSGADSLVMTGGAIVSTTGLTTPEVDGAYNLDASTGTIELLGGVDMVDISGTATIGGVGDPIQLILGAGADTFNMTGGTITGFVIGQGGGNIYTMSGGTIVGSIFAGSENDNVTISGDADIQAGGGDAVGLEDGDDVFTMTAGTLDGAVSGGAGADVINFGGGGISGFIDGNDGDDQIYVTGGALAGELLSEAGDDLIVISDGTIGGSVTAGDGDDTVRVLGGVIGTAGVDLGAGTNTFEMSGGTVTGSVFGFDGVDTFTVSGGAIDGSLFAGGGNDVVTISGTASIMENVTFVAPPPDSVGLGDGDDTLTMTGGTLGGSLSAGAGNDVLAISGGTISSFVAGNEGNDEITVSGGTISDDVRGNEGDDTVTVSGGTIAGTVEGEDVTVSGGTIAGDVEGAHVLLNGGSIGGDITGLGPDTLTIENTNVADPLNLRDGVVFSGVGANGSLTDTDLSAGGTKSQNFAGFNNFSADNSSLMFDGGNQDIAGTLGLGGGSTLFVNGAVNMPGSATVTDSLIDMRDGTADDVFTLGGLTLDNAQIGLDVNQQTAQADQLVAAAFSATGTNTIIVNLLGAPEFTAPTDIPLIVATNGPVPGTFVIQGAPGTPGSLFTYQLVPGAGGGLVLRASPANFGIAAAPNSAVNASTVETAIDALYGISRDAIDADLRLSPGPGMVQITPTFGVFASGQFAHTDHDGYTITNNVLSGPGPSFDADDFSAAISVDFNAAKHFQFDNQYGLNLGLFAGYASTDVALGAFQGFSAIGNGDNKSGMFGGYALFRQGYSYGLVAASAFLGGTDVTNGVLGTTGSYDTEGYAVTGSVGHIFKLSDRVRFDLRGGLLGVSFHGDAFTDSGGTEFGRSRLSFGAVKFEPGVYADYQLKNGMVFSPYARAELQQRFSYKNITEIDGREIDFDDADFSAALSTGFNMKVSQSATVSGEVRGKWSSDSSTVGGKLGLKVAF